MAFEALKDRQAAAYSNSKFELLAETAADIDDDLVDRLGVRAGSGGLTWLLVPAQSPFVPPAGVRW
jgi:hypothetical protein